MLVIRYYFIRFSRTLCRIIRFDLLTNRYVLLVLFRIKSYVYIIINLNVYMAIAQLAGTYRGFVVGIGRDISSSSIRIYSVQRF